MTGMLRRAIVAALVLTFLAGCAASRTAGVPIEERPTPPQPAKRDTVAVERIHVEPVVPEGERARLVEQVVADTTEAGRAVRRCNGRKLLPEQESTIESTLNFLRDAREALRAGELSRAESNARKAKALAASLRCS